MHLGRGGRKAELVAAIERDLGDAFPGTPFAFSQMIRDNIEEAQTGVKGENTVKIFGPDARVDEEGGWRILAGVRGVTDDRMLASTGQPAVRLGLLKRPA